MPLLSDHPLFSFIKWKLLTKHLDLRRSFTSLTINPFIEKDSFWGSAPQINILGLLDWFLKTLLIAIKPWAISQGESLLILFLPQRIATFFNDGRNRIFLAPQRTFSTRSPQMPTLMNLLPKRLFQTVSISWYYGWVSRYVLFLPKLKGKERPFLEGCKKGDHTARLSLGWYKRWKSISIYETWQTCFCLCGIIKLKYS